MGRFSRERVVRIFAPSQNHVLDQMVAIYDELLAGSQVGNPKPAESTAA